MKKLIWNKDGAELVKNLISKKLIKKSVSKIKELEKKKKLCI